MLSYDLYGLACTFIAKLLRKSQYEGRMWWPEHGRKKPYGLHTGILSIACAKCEPSEHSKIDYPKKKKKEKRGCHIIKCLLTELGQAGWENISHSVRTPRPWTKYFPVWSFHSVNKHIIFIPSKRITNQNINRGYLLIKWFQKSIHCSSRNDYSSRF